MSLLKIILLSVAGMIILGIIIGLIVGKTMRKRQSPGFNPVLSKAEKIISMVSVAVGVVIILVGIFIPTPAPAADPNGMMGEEGMEFSEGATGGGSASGGDVWVGESYDGMITEVMPVG